MERREAPQPPSRPPLESPRLLSLLPDTRVRGHHRVCWRSGATTGCNPLAFRDLGIHPSPRATCSTSGHASVLWRNPTHPNPSSFPHVSARMPTLPQGPYESPFLLCPVLGHFLTSPEGGTPHLLTRHGRRSTHRL